jgi:hypothetical protein
MSDRRDAAVCYSSAGWPVFPVAADRPDCERGEDCRCKTPLTRNGFKDAETDPGTVARYWVRHPDANIGVATGRPGPDVLDVDISEGKPGHRSLNEAVRAGLVPSPMASVRTGTGGSCHQDARRPARRRHLRDCRPLAARGTGHRTGLNAAQVADHPQLPEGANARESGVTVCDGPVAKSQTRTSEPRQAIAAPGGAEDPQLLTGKKGIR